MSNTDAAERWQSDRTTFQRVYDVLVGTTSYQSVQELAERAACSETAAREALDQLTEMGIAQRQNGRPATYRRNESYLRWKRIESLARDHSPATLRERLADLIADDEDYQAEYGVPTPDAVSTSELPVDDHDAHETLWEDLTDWRTVRRDIQVVRRAIERAESRTDDGAVA